MSDYENQTQSPDVDEELGPIPLSEIKSICETEQHHETKGYRFIRTAYHIKDPRRSIKFYNSLGMSLLNALDVPRLKFTVYCMGILAPDEEIPTSSSSKDEMDSHYWALTRSSTLELVYKWGTDSDPSFHYDLGNGNMNITIMVPDVREATERLQKLGVVFSKTPDEGTVIGLAYFLDPDGYVIEMYDSQMIPPVFK